MAQYYYQTTKNRRSAEKAAGHIVWAIKYLDRIRFDQRAEASAERVAEVRIFLVNSIMDLISATGNDNLFYACKRINRTGYHLSHDEKITLAQKINDVNTQNFLRSVRRARHWECNNKEYNNKVTK